MNSLYYPGSETGGGGGGGGIVKFIVLAARDYNSDINIFDPPKLIITIFPL